MKEEKMVIPEEWTRRTIKELGDGLPSIVQTGPFGAQLHAEDYIEEGVPLLLIRNLKDGKLDFSGMPRISDADAARLQRYRLQPGDVVFSRVGRVGSCFLADYDHSGWLISGQLLRVRVNPASIDRRYLYRALTSKYAQDHIADKSVGTTRTSINTQILESLTLLVPTSIPEQAKIAEVLSTLDHAIEQTEALIAKQQRIKTGLMQDLLTRGIDEHGNLRSEETHEFKDSLLGRIPVEWEPTTLKKMGTWASGGTPSKSNQRFWGGEIPWVTPKDMKSFDLENTTDKITDAGVRFGSNLMPEGTVFIVIRGMILAHTFPVGYATRPMAFNQDMKAIVAKPGVAARYLAYWLSAHEHAILKIATTATHGTKRFDMNELYGVEVPLPDESEQRRIAGFLDHHQEHILQTKFHERKLRSLKTALMQDLLTGEKRVTPLLEAADDQLAGGAS